MGVEAVTILGTVVMAFVGFMLGLAMYLLPSIIAMRRRHPNGAPIFIVNFFLGWTVLGWIIALSWSVSSIYRR